MKALEDPAQNQVQPAVLIIDDDAEFASLLGEYLSTEGFAVRCAEDGQLGLAAALSGESDIVILDVMLPSLVGTEVLREIRNQSDIPVLMLTARGDDIDRIVGLELGADYYLPKPCNPREVVARLRAILRRSAEAPPPTELSSGPLRLNSADRSAWYLDQRLDLTGTEFAILELLMQHAGTAVSKDQLSRHALHKPLGRYDRSVDMHISHLRRKLQAQDSAGELIATVRGVGYQLVVNPT